MSASHQARNALRWLALTAALCLLAAWQHSPGRVEAGSTPQVKLSTESAGPRKIEQLTESSIRRNYAYAWENLAQAFERNQPSLLSADFVGSARSALTEAVVEQKQAGLRSRYLDQDHQVEAVFYAPEGDVVELHDTATYEFQLADGEKVVHDEHATVRYVVLMTPGADRWLVRQLQAVPKF
jgi:hypothetical protein